MDAQQDGLTMSVLLLGFYVTIMVLAWMVGE